MKTPVMPKNLQDMLRYAFREGDADMVIHYNRIWNAHVKEVREEYQKEAVLKASQVEGSYQNEE